MERTSGLSWRNLLGNAGIAAIYATVAWGNLRLFATLNASASPVWPPTGIAIAALLLWGARYWPGVFLGAFTANLLTAGTVATSAAIATGNALEAVVGALLVRRYAGGVEAFSRARNLLIFVSGAGLVAPLVSATVGATTLGLAGFLPWPLYGIVWTTWYLGDAAGALVVAPLLLLLLPAMGRRPLRFLDGGKGEAIALAMALVAAGLAVFSPFVFTNLPHVPLSFTIIPLVVWAAIRFGPLGAAMATFLLSTFAVWGTLAGYGPFAGAQANAALLFLQFFMMVVSTTGLALGAIAHERRDAVEEGEKARQAEAKLAEAQAVAQVGSWEWDITRNVVTWSPELYRIFGLSPQAFGASYDAYLAALPPDDRKVADAAVRRAMEDHQPFTFEHKVIRPDGSTAIVLGRGRAEYDPSGRPVRMSGTAQDITERKRLEEERLQTEAKFRALLESAPDAMVIVNQGGTITLVNAQTEAMFGYRRQDLVGKPVEILIPERFAAVHPVHRNRYFAAPTTRPMGANLALFGRRQDGTEFPVEISLSPIRAEGGLVAVAIVRDITARKAAESELEASRRQVAVSEKLAALGTMVSGVGHEIRTPLTYINTNLALVKLRIDRVVAGQEPADVAAQEVAKLLKKSKEGVERIDRIVRQLRQFAKAQIQMEPTALHEVVASAVDLFRSVRKGQVTIRADLPPLTGFEVDKGQVQQVLINLFNNGAEAMGNRGELKVRLRPTPGGAEIEVEDAGPGIPKEVQTRLFDPFFTTKTEGTGLGLSISRRIIDAHGGTIRFKTGPHGTTFTVALPAGKPPLKQPPSEAKG